MGSYDKVPRPIPQEDWWRDTRAPKHAGAFVPDALGTTGLPGPYVPVNLRLTKMLQQAEPSNMRRSQSLDFFPATAGGLTQSTPKMYNAGSVPLLNTDWYYQMTKQTLEASKKSSQRSATVTVVRG